MSRNRLNGDALTTSLLPVAAGGTFQEGLADDVLQVPAAFAAGVHTVNLNGTVAGQAVPGDGDQLDICDPLGLLAPGTSLVVVGKIGGLGGQIADAGALSNSIVLNTPGANRTFTFNGATGTWVTSSSSAQQSPPPVAIVDAAATTITAAQGLFRTLTATQANALTLDPANGAKAGQTLRVVRNDTSAFAITFIDGGPGTPTLFVAIASKRGFADFYFNGTNWILSACSAS